MHFNFVTQKHLVEEGMVWSPGSQKGTGCCEKGKHCLRILAGLLIKALPQGGGGDTFIS